MIYSLGPGIGCTQSLHSCRILFWEWWSRSGGCLSRGWWSGGCWSTAKSGYHEMATISRHWWYERFFDEMSERERMEWNARYAVNCGMRTPAFNSMYACGVLWIWDFVLVIISFCYFCLSFRSGIVVLHRSQVGSRVISFFFFFLHR